MNKRKTPHEIASQYLWSRLVFPALHRKITIDLYGDDFYEAYYNHGNGD